MKTVLITGADRGLGLELVRCFLAEGYRVFAGQFMPEWDELRATGQKGGSGELILLPLNVSSDASVATAIQKAAEITSVLDMVVNNAGIAGEKGELRGDIDFRRSGDMFQTNTLGAMRVVSKALPLLQQGMKRICFISSDASSIQTCHRTEGFGYAMSKAAVNMFARMIHNQLYPQGYTVRLYHPGWMRTYMMGQKGAAGGVIEPWESAAAAFRYFTRPLACEENLVLQDNEGRCWPF